jgi:2-(1,2-epoxy-1,2-dihydrophenyl)acetyl-CoA isomerase
MIYKVYSDETFASESSALAQSLATMPTKGIALTKTLLNETYKNSLSQQLNREGELQVEASQTHDYKEGVSAFLEKRKPVFKGN